MATLVRIGTAYVQHFVSQFRTQIHVLLGSKTSFWWVFIFNPFMRIMDNFPPLLPVWSGKCVVDRDKYMKTANLEVKIRLGLVDRPWCSILWSCVGEGFSCQTWYWFINQIDLPQVCRPLWWHLREIKHGEDFIPFWWKGPGQTLCMGCEMAASDPAETHQYPSAGFTKTGGCKIWRSSA